MDNSQIIICELFVVYLIVVFMGLYIWIGIVSWIVTLII